MNKKTNKKIIWISLALMILLAANVFALGIAPGKKEIDFKPGLHEELKVRILNNQQKDLRVVVSARGDLAEYLDIKEKLLNIPAEESSVDFDYELELPETMIKPGEHRIDIVATEFIGTSSKDNAISATAAVISQLIIKVPYPGKYVEGKLYITNTEGKEPPDFSIALFNFGTEKVNNCSADIEILGPTNERVAYLQTSSTSIMPNSEGKIMAKMYGALNGGRYAATARIRCDESTLRIDQNFEIGSLLVDVVSVSAPAGFKLGQIAKLDILLENRWNQKIDNLYGNVIIKDKQGKEYTNFKTATISLEPNSKGNLEAFWDTAGAYAGIYDVKVVLNYANKMTEKLFELEVNLNSIVTRGLLPTGSYIVGQESFADKNKSLIMLLIVVLIVINISWFVYFAVRKRNQP